MKRLTLIFVLIIMATISTFALLWAVSPVTEKENVMASQGIRLIGSAVVVSADNTLKPTRVKIGDLLMGTNEQIFRINELRKAQNNKIYAVVSWKYITSFLTYEEYIAEPYMNYKTYELNSFVFNKKVIVEADLVQFYANYKSKLAANIKTESIKKVAGTVVDNRDKSHIQVPQPQLSSRSKLAAKASNPTESAPRSYMSSTDVQSAQAYSSAEVSTPTDMDNQSVKSLESIIAEQVKTSDPDPIE